MNAKRCVFAIAIVIMSCGGEIAGGLSGGLSGEIGGLTDQANLSGEFAPRCLEDFGESESAQKLESFMAATDGFRNSATEIQETLLNTCQAMGRELSMADSELAGSGAEGTRTVCEAVSNKIREEMNAVRAAAGVTVTIRARPPQCSVSVDAYAGCAAECDVNVEPGSVEIQCEGGEIRGQCSAECSGSCAVDANAACQGTCEGICEGTCSATAEDGSCNGSCAGNCRGSCVAEVSGSCSGQCRGGCSVDFEAPTCSGTMTPPNVSAECQASCNARLDAQASCEPGEVEVAISGRLETNLQERAEKLQAAVRAGLGTIMTTKARLERLRGSGQEVVRLAAQLPGAVAGIGLEAANCARGAISELQGAMGNVTVSAEVSVSVAGSISG